MQPTIHYTVEVLHPITGKLISLNVKKFKDWHEVETQIITDKRHFVDMAHCTMRYSANDNQVELTGSYGG